MCRQKMKNLVYSICFLKRDNLKSLEKRKKKYKYQILDKRNEIWYNIKDALSDARKKLIFEN